MPVGPYSPDILTHIINVNWGGGSFVFAEQYGNKLYSVTFTGNEPNITTISLPEPPSQDPDSVDPIFAISGATFALVDKITGGKQPVFLVCGLTIVGNDVTFADRYSRIYRSTDGQTWTLVLDWHTGGNPASQGAQVSGLVWDPNTKLFYFNQGDHVQVDVFAFSVKDEIFSSPDGTTWTRISSVDNNVDPAFVSPFSTVHCAHNKCIDSYGHHVPDGVHWQGDVDLTRPTDPPDVNYTQGGVSFWLGSNMIEIIRDGVTTPAPIPGVASVTCVAQTGGAMMVGGFTIQQPNGPGAVAYSLDDGKNWQPLTTTETGVTTMVAGTSAPTSP